MIRGPPRSTRTDTLFPYTTLFRSMDKATGTLKRGMKIGDAVHKEFELRQCTAADYFAAEGSADSSKSITYQAALVAQQLVRIGEFSGPLDRKSTRLNSSH